MSKLVPVIDLFAGPGGLCEGFSKSEKANFETVVSIEKDGMAHETLRLRAAHRALQREGASSATWSTWDSIVAEEPWNIVFDKLADCGNDSIEKACRLARSEAWCIELGPANRRAIAQGIHDRLAARIGNNEIPENSVLIGGPPCQAYSMVGRSRNRGVKGYTAEQDHRHFLYLEYLSVIAEFRPAVFVMENVKGILTSKVGGGQIFHTICADLRRPDKAVRREEGLEYVLVALPRGATSLAEPAPTDFIIEAEHFGIPQARHRVIICGVRRDVFERAKRVRSLRTAEPPSVLSVIGDLPELQPALSFRGKGYSFQDCFDVPILRDAISELTSSSDGTTKRLGQLLDRERRRMLGRRTTGHGADRSPVARHPRAAALTSWYADRAVSVICNHEARAHMPDDLARYFFVAMYGKLHEESPKLPHFPAALLPNHRNVVAGEAADAIFKDRFRVQIEGRHSMTVTSHIGKDGHAFIHYDPMQCRSLTVREAARLQTFPDSYVFLGNRTSQYVQVGNAVPPLLARKMADIVATLLADAGLA